jgi:hypothetical protein
MFHFTIRDVLWLTVVVALGASCYVTNQRAARVQKENDALSAQAEHVEHLYKDATKLLGENSKTQSASAMRGLSRMGYERVSNLDEAAAVLRSQLIADGKPELALLLNDDQLRYAIRKMTESFEPRINKKAEWTERIRPLCVKMADEGYWPPGSSFDGFYRLTENNVTYDGLGLRLNVAKASFSALPVVNVWFGKSARVPSTSSTTGKQESPPLSSTQPPTDNRP